jgi:hypothetical protein
MSDILSPNSRKEYPGAVGALKARRKMISARRLLLRKQLSYIYLK